MDKEHLRSKIAEFIPEFTKYNQQHVFANYEQLPLDKLTHLYDSISSFSLPFLVDSFDSLVKNPKKSASLETFEPYSSGGLDLSKMNDSTLYSLPMTTSTLNCINLSLSTRQQTQAAEPTQPTPSTTLILPPDENDRSFYFNTAMESILMNKIGVVLLAGGQGSRLQFDKSKGLFPVATPSHHVLFYRTLWNRYLLLQLARSYHQHKYNLSDQPVSSITLQQISIPLIILTSPQTHHEIQEYFASLHQKLSSSPQTVPDSLELIRDIFFVQQGSLPLLDMNGNIVLSDDMMVMGPNGNGGAFPALFPLLTALQNGTVSCPYNIPYNLTPQQSSKPINQIQSFNLTHIMFLNIDNILSKVCDPITLGYAIHTNADICVKTVAKKTPSERVGVIGVKDNKVQIVEYSEICEKSTEIDENTGDLKYIDGNTNILVYAIPFLYQHRGQLCGAVEGFTSSSTQGDAEKELSNNPNPADPLVFMPLHRADKKAKVYPNSIQKVTINIDEHSTDENKTNTLSSTFTTIPVIKFELFGFDSFPYASNIKVVRVNRHSHFLPVKSKNHDDPTIIAPDTPSYCIDRSNKLTISTLLRLGYTIYDTDGKKLQDHCLHSETSKHLTCLHYSEQCSLNGENYNQNGEICLCDAKLGRGIELDITQFYSCSFPALIHNASSEKNFPDDNLLNVMRVINFTKPTEANHDIRLSNEHGIIFHADATISKIASQPASL